MSALTVVIGPKTRFGRALVERVRDSAPVLLVARDSSDAAALTESFGAGEHSSVSVVDGSRGDLGTAVKALGADQVRLVVAALGPVHPEQPAYDVDGPAVSRDLALVTQVLDAGVPVQVVLVSTILAFAPSEDRRYYGGWKALLEQQLQQLVDDHRDAGGRATLSVLYPGRLVDGSERSGHLRLHSSYARLARRALTADPDQSIGRLVGIDTRIWLWVRCISFAFRSLKTTTARSVPRPPSAANSESVLPGESG